MALNNMTKRIIKQITPPIIITSAKWLLNKLVRRRCPNITFFLVAPHGVGTQSFLYYLSLAGIPASYWLWYKNFEMPDLSSFPVKKTAMIYRYGLTVDHVFPQKIVIDKFLPVIWLLRDPISLITSCVNQMIGDSLNVYCHYNNFINLESSIQKIMATSSYYWKYSSQLSSIQNYGDILALDMTDILPDSIDDTFKRIEHVLNFKYKNISRDKFIIKYNSFENRYFCWAPAIPFDDGDISFCKSQLFDYHFNHFMRRAGQIIENIRVNGDEYCIFFVSETSRLNSKINIDWISSIITHYLYHREYDIKQFLSSKVNDEDIISCIKKDKNLYDTFLFGLKKEMKLVHKYAPNIIDNWKSLHKLGY